MNARSSPRSRNRRWSLVALALALPLVTLGTVWKVALDRVPSPLPDPPAAQMAAASTRTAQAPGAAMATALMSLRRTPGPLADEAAAVASAQLIEPVLDMITADSCAVVTRGHEPLFEVNPGLTAPAGNAQHLVIAAVALELLGTNGAYRTRVMGPGLVDGVINGDLFLVGGGDPVLRSASPGTVRVAVAAPTSLDALADQLIEAGLVRVEGDLVGDGSRYDAEFVPSSWDSAITREVAGPISALLVNEGRLFGSGYGLNPAQAAAGELNRLLSARGVVITGRNRSGTAPTADLVELAIVESVPVEQIVSHLLDTADDTVAEMMLKEIGVVANGEGTRGGGLRAVQEQLQHWGMYYADETLIDGSGLSAGNEIGCALLAGVLGAQAHTGQALLPETVSESPPGETLPRWPVGVRIRVASAGTTRTLVAQVPSTDGQLISVALMATEVPDEPRSTDPQWWREVIDAAMQYPVLVPVERFAPVQAG